MGKKSRSRLKSSSARSRRLPDHSLSDSDSSRHQQQQPPKQRKKHAALHRLLNPLTSAPASAIVDPHRDPHFHSDDHSHHSHHSRHSCSETETDSDSDSDSTRDSHFRPPSKMISAHVPLPSLPTPGDPASDATPHSTRSLPPPVGLDGPSRAQALRSTLSLLRPAASSSTHRPPRPPRAPAIPTSTVSSPLTQSPIHAFHAMLETQDARIRDQWAQQYLNNGLAGPSPKGWRMTSITKSPLYNLKDTQGVVPSLKTFALAGYLRRVQVLHHMYVTGGTMAAGGQACLRRLVPAHVLPANVRQLILLHLPFYVTPTDANLAWWRSDEEQGAAALEYVNLSNGRFSAAALASVLDPPPDHEQALGLANAKSRLRCDSGVLADVDDDHVPDSWDDDTSNSIVLSTSHLPPPPPPLTSLDLSFCTLPQPDLIRALTSSARAASLLHLNLSGVIFSIADAGWSLSCLSNHLLHLVGLEINYAPWVTKEVLACVDWATRWRNLRVLAMHKSVVQGVADVRAIVEWMGKERPEVRVMVDAP